MSGPLRLRHRVLEVIRQQHLWDPGQTVHVACSGGRDSTVLLDVLHQTQRAHGGMLVVINVDHGQRSSSIQDAGFVEALADDRGLPYVLFKVHCGASEDAMRSARHAEFARLDGVVALGHHRRDQAETLLLQLLRGAGTQGRGAMRVQRDHLVRPLLQESTEALAAWADQRGLGHRVDPSNASPRALRNQLRHEVLPMLERLRPGAEKALARAARHAQEDERLLQRLAADHPLTGRWMKSGEPALVRRAVLCRWPFLSAAHLDALLEAAKAGGGAVALPAGVTLHVDDSAVWLEGVGAEGSGVTY